MIIILQSAIVYFSFALILFALGRIAESRESYYLKRGRQLTFWTWEISGSLLVFAFISGVRWNVGADYQYYLGEFNHAQKFGETIRDYEYGFALITKSIAFLGFNYVFYFAFLAFLQLLFVYRTFNKERYLIPYVGLTVVLGFHYLTWMNGIRQMLAATIFLFSIQFIIKRKLYIYLIAILTASLIHKSSIILLLLYLIPNRDIFSNRYFTLIVSTICLYVGMDPNWISFVGGDISKVVSIIGYDGYSESIGLFVEQSNNTNFGPRMLTTYLLFIMVVFYSPNLKKYFKETNFLMYYNIYVIGFLLYWLFANSHHIFLRPITYLTICSIPVVSYLLFYLSTNLKKKIASFLIALALSTAYTPISFIADYGLGNEDYSNYKFAWFQNY